MTNPQRQVASYRAIFDGVHRKRLRHVNRVIVLVAVVVLLALKAPFNAPASFLACLYQVPLLCTAFVLFKLARNATATVECLRAATVVRRMAETVASPAFVVSYVHLLTSAVFFFGAFLAQRPLLHQYAVLSKEFRKRPAVNDQWVYFWFHGGMCAAVYAAQLVVLLRHRLRFHCGVASVKPRAALSRGLAPVFVNAAVLTFVVAVVTPPAYYWARGSLYRLSWLVLALLSLDTAMPPLNIGVRNWATASLASLLLFLSWDFVSHVYNTYATIGCLDGKATISTKSATPVETLLLGLRDVFPESQLARLTAFQELAYVASSSDPACADMRRAIYAPAERTLSVCLAILDECSLVIDEAALSVNFRTRADLDALRNLNFPMAEEIDDTTAKDSSIFGNSTKLPPAAPTLKTPKTPGQEMAADPALLQNKTPASKLDMWWQLAKKHAYKFVYAAPDATYKVDGVKDIRDAIRAQKKKFLDSRAGVLFRVSLKQDAEARLPNPINCGNAIIAVAGILLHAVEEDRHNTITDQHVSTVFNLLERPIRACSNYINVPPASVHLTELQRKSADHRTQLIVTVIHDMAMREFIGLCLRYNYKLNDLLLTHKAFKLAKWVIDASIAQQVEQRQQQMREVL